MILSHKPEGYAFELVVKYLNKSIWPIFLVAVGLVLEKSPG